MTIFQFLVEGMGKSVRVQ